MLFRYKNKIGDFYSMQKLIWRTIRAQRTKLRNDVTSRKISISTWMEYPARIYKAEATEINNK